MDGKTPKLKKEEGQKHVNELVDWFVNTKQITDKRMQRRITGLAYLQLTKEIKKEETTE